MREDDALKLTNELLDGETSPAEILGDCKKAMDVIGKRFEEGEAFIPELILAGEMLAAISAVLKPRMAKVAAIEKSGKIAFGTVQGDIHDIAKDQGYRGFHARPERLRSDRSGGGRFARQLRRSSQKDRRKDRRLSGFLTLAFDPMKETVSALKAAGLTDDKVMIGGGQRDDQVRQYTGADAHGKDAMAAVALAKGWLGE